jgi:hypothetical protein
MTGGCVELDRFVENAKRKAPPYDAQACHEAGVKTREGKDGRMYEAREMVSYRWVRAASKKTMATTKKSKKTTTASKTGNIAPPLQEAALLAMAASTDASKKIKKRIVPIMVVPANASDADIQKAINAASSSSSSSGMETTVVQVKNDSQAHKAAMEAVKEDAKTKKRNINVTVIESSSSKNLPLTMVMTSAENAPIAMAAINAEVREQNSADATTLVKKKKHITPIMVSTTSDKASVAAAVTAVQEAAVKQTNRDNVAAPIVFVTKEEDDKSDEIDTSFWSELIEVENDGHVQKAAAKFVNRWMEDGTHETKIVDIFSADARRTLVLITTDDESKALAKFKKGVKYTNENIMKRNRIVPYVVKTTSDNVVKAIAKAQKHIAGLRPEKNVIVTPTIIVTPAVEDIVVAEEDDDSLQINVNNNEEAKQEAVRIVKEWANGGSHGYKKILILNKRRPLELLLTQDSASAVSEFVREVEEYNTTMAKRKQLIPIIMSTISDNIAQAVAKVQQMAEVRSVKSDEKVIMAIVVTPSVAQPDVGKCKKLTSKYYSERKTLPPYHPEKCQGVLRRGNDGQIYMSVLVKGQWVWRVADKVPDTKKETAVRNAKPL